MLVQVSEKMEIHVGNPIIISLYHVMVHVSQFYHACYFFRKTAGCINHALPNTKGNVAESDDSEDLEVGPRARL